MNLSLSVPSELMLEKKGVRRIVAETKDGFFGILPARLDCTAILVPSILLYETEDNTEHFIAVDEGLLVKVGSDVRVSVRHASLVENLETLSQAVKDEIFAQSEQEKHIRLLLAKLESDFIRNLMEFFGMDKKNFRHEALKKGKRRLNAKGKKEVNAWWGFSLFGLVGWTVVVPALIGVFIGLWLDAPGQHKWTLSLLLTGICIGCLIAFALLQKEIGEDE